MLFRFFFLASLVSGLSFGGSSLLLFRQSNVYSDKLQFVEHDRSPIKRMRVASCEAITGSQVDYMLSEYPNFLVICEKEGTLLYPTELDNENVQAAGMRAMVKAKVSREYRLTEMKITLREESDVLQIPLSPCIYVSGENTTGSIEFKFTLGAGFGQSGGVDLGLTFPFLGVSSSLGVGNAKVRRFVIDHSCAFDGYGVRPVVSMTTIDFAVKMRTWQVRARSRKPPKKSDWEAIEQMWFSNHAPVFSCVSELHVPGVCLWPQDRAKAEDGTEIRIEGQ